jgi:putative Mg2+ transporter-C (MgtC) family protein
MPYIFDLLSRNDLTTGAAAARLVLALLAGGLIGIEREMHRQTAGLRTHILICLGACLLTLLSIWMPQAFLPVFKSSDPTRITAQIVSGIGFLGAGAIIKIGNNTKGLTTAASIWGVAAIGMGIGGGMWGPALIGLALMLATLSLLEPVEKHFFPPERIKVLQIWYDESTADRAKVDAVLKAHGLRLQSIDAFQSIAKKETRLSLLVKVPIDVDIERLFKGLKGTGRVVKIRMEENY